jgi:hypothetical protein
MAAAGARKGNKMNSVTTDSSELQMIKLARAAAVTQVNK